MKKLSVLLLVALGLSISACKKFFDFPGGQPTIVTHKVSFRFSGLNHNVGEANVGMQTEPLKNYISQLTVIAYDAKTGEEIQRNTQFSTLLDFGNFSFKLKPAQYRFVAIGSNSPFGISQFYKLDTIPVKLPYQEARMEYIQETSDPYNRHYATSDTFLARKVMTINKDETVELVMQRIVGKLEFEVLDSPDFKLSELYDERTAFKLSTDSVMSRVRNYTFPEFTVVNGKMSLYILNTQGTLAIESGIWGHPLYIQDLRVYPNKTSLVKVNILRDEYTVTVK